MNPTTRNFSIGIFIILAIGALALWQPETDCSHPSGKIVIIIDQTEKFSDETKRSIADHSIKLIEETAPNTSISIRYLLANGLKGQKLTSCRPDSPKITTELTKDKDTVKKDWNKFLDNFRAAINQDYSTQSASPIYISLVNAAREEFIGIDNSKVIAVFSDFKDFNPGKSNIHDSCENSAYSSIGILKSLPISSADKPFNGITVKRFMIPRVSMNKQSLRCLTDVSDRIVNELSGDKSEQLDQIILLPQS